MTKEKKLELILKIIGPIPKCKFAQVEDFLEDLEVVLEICDVEEVKTPVFKMGVLFGNNEGLVIRIEGRDYNEGLYGIIQEGSNIGDTVYLNHEVNRDEWTELEG